MKIKWHNKVLTFKWPARIIAVFVIVFLVFASILYFNDTLFAALKKYQSNGLLSGRIVETLSWAMAITIGLGVFAESALGIWNTLVYWGQCADNWLIKRITGQEYFVNRANNLLADIRIQLNRINLALQTMTCKDCHDGELQQKLQKLNEQCQAVKSHCREVNKILENTEARDTINYQRQEQAKMVLNTLVTENLHISDRIEMLMNKLQQAKN